ncbi:MAG: elongation factor G [Acidobacteriota bacterium]
MKTHKTIAIRNLAFIGHGQCGKTSLVEALLFQGGMVDRLGTVEAKNATTDYWDDEQEHGMSIRLSLAHRVQGDTKLNLFDCPGAGNFQHEATLALENVEAAVGVVDAVSGVEVQTARAWKNAGEAGTPARFVVLNKMDKENADFEVALDKIRTGLGRECAPIQVPIGKEDDFKGVVDLITGKAHLSATDGSGKSEEADAPADVADAVSTHREALMEMVAESDEELMETFLEEGELTEAQLREGLLKAVATGQVYPVCCASATKLVGIGALADALAGVAPDPTILGARKSADGESERELSVDAPLSLQVFKTLADPFAGRVTLFKVYSGVLSGDNALRNTTKDTDERCSAPSVLQGKEQSKVSELHPGDVGCFIKLKETLTGDTLSDKGSPIEYGVPKKSDPPMSFSIRAANTGDEEKIGNALAKIAEEDQAMVFRFDPQTKEMVLSGMGERHVGNIAERLKNRYKVEVVLDTPRVPYKETITKPASGSYRHKKQSGGSGQFAEVHMEVKPLPGEGYEFDTGRIFGGSISQNFFSSIDKGIRQVLESGPLCNAEVVDVRCEVFDGKMHPVDSKDVAFQIAGRQLMRQLILDAKPQILEPIVQVAVTVPEECMGDVMGDLSGRRGKVQGMEAEGGNQVIKAQVPLKEMLTYTATLKSISGGRGDFTMEMDHYEPVPSNLQKEIMEEAAKHRTEDADA